MPTPRRSLTVVLPIPDSRLGLNGSHGHWRGKAWIRQEHRHAARILTQATLKGEQPLWEDRVWVDLLWVVKNPAWFPDDDGAWARCKAYRDGVGDAGLFVNDKQVRLREFTTQKGDNPRVELTFEQAAVEAVKGDGA
jgi:hypothetical protein